MAAQSKCVPFKSFLNPALPAAVIASHSGEWAGSPSADLIAAGAVPGSPSGSEQWWDPVLCLQERCGLLRLPVPSVTWTGPCPAPHVGTLGIQGFACRLEADTRSWVCKRPGWKKPGCWARCRLSCSWPPRGCWRGPQADRHACPETSRPRVSSACARPAGCLRSPCFRIIP